MELQELKNKTLKLFKIEEIKDLSTKIFEVCINNEIEYFKEFKKMVNNDLQTDWLQKIYQYYSADRKNKKQDFTPKSLAMLISRLSQDEKEKKCIDMCSGTGSLTIQKWVLNPNLEFEMWEIDENVIPFTIFNMMLRNIKSEIYQKDVLKNEVYHIYRIHQQEEFGKVEKIK